ncbi:hypothetical protein [Vallitalea okinawensis]|uniref:hypothetical protein n=1 Tax=Vallitalea okinawensis TaxID=2078660 RepID=UPI000CFD20C7|nr:hypothetical protein [Vallitalea okinawensis]
MLDQKEISVLAVQIHRDTRNIEDAKEKLMDITADGIISGDEEEDVHENMNYFEQMRKTL